MIKYRLGAESSDCPFYTTDTKKQKHCFLKYVGNLNVFNEVVETPSPITKTTWQKDCTGDWENCCFVPLLYDMTIEPQKEEPQMEYTDKKIDDYDPFGEEQEEQEEQEESKESSDEEDVIDESNSEKQVVVKINKVSDPYRVKADVLVYPTNSTLLIDDPLLNRHSRFKIQEECDVYVNKLDIEMGMVYPTSNGGDFPDGVVPKKIYHAVVAGESRLVSKNISNTTAQALILAERQKAKVVVMLPFDCGMIDVGETARLQLTAIKNFLDNIEIENIERIHIVMDDDESISIFKEYFERIF
jgi:hypothetical protein